MFNRFSVFMINESQIITAQKCKISSGYALSHHASQHYLRLYNMQYTPGETTRATKYKDIINVRQRWSKSRRETECPPWTEKNEPALPPLVATNPGALPAAAARPTAAAGLKPSPPVARLRVRDKPRSNCIMINQSVLTYRPCYETDCCNIQQNTATVFLGEVRNQTEQRGPTARVQPKLPRYHTGDKNECPRTIKPSKTKIKQKTAQ